MKKFILSVVAVAAFASYNVYRSNNNETEGMSDTMLANVEALARAEVIVGMPCMVVPNNYCIYIGQTPDQDFELPGAFHD